MKKTLYFLVSFICSKSFAQTAVTSYIIVAATPAVTTNSSTGFNSTGATFPSSTTYINNYGIANGGVPGVERVVNGFSIGALSYSKVPSANNNPFDAVIVRRHPSVPGDTVNTLYEHTASNGTNLYFQAGYLNTLENVINSFTCNRGSDNTFANNGSTRSNIERIDLVKTGAIIVTAPSKQGFLINERNGNDPIKVAAITSIDASLNVISFGTLTNISSTSWGVVGPDIVSTILSRRQATDVDLRPKQTLSSQTISGVFISFADLGLPAGATIFGLSVFPNDVTSAMDLINLTDVPANTDNATAGGIDMMAGGGFFVENSILPVNGLQLNVQKNMGSVTLNWSTLSETNTLRFEVQRSDNGQNFNKIGEVAAAQNSTTIQAYSFIDNTPFNRNNYYRLKLVDADGQVNFSPVKQMLFSEIAFKLSPNPVVDRFVIYSPFDSNTAFLLVKNNSGAVVLKQKIRDRQTFIDAKKLSAGIYFAEINNGSQKTGVIQFVKQ